MYFRPEIILSLDCWIIKYHQRRFMLCGGFRFNATELYSVIILLDISHVLPLDLLYVTLNVCHFKSKVVVPKLYLQRQMLFFMTV